MKRNILALGLICSFLNGCVSIETPAFREKYWLDYDVSLYAVERPTEAKASYGEQIIFSTKESHYKYSFEDEMVRILWVVNPTNLSFLLTNKTDHSIRIIWDEAVYVDESRESNRVIHSGVKYVDKNKSYPPSVVVRKGTLTDVIIPTNKIHFTDSLGWIEEPILKFWYKGHSLLERDLTDEEILDLEKNFIFELFLLTEVPPEIRARTKEELLKQGNAVVGNTIQVLLPFQIEGVTNDYIFTFKVNDVKLETK